MSCLHLHQSFKIAVSIDGTHAEAFNNLGVLELRKGNVDHARSNFQQSERLAGHIFEPSFNGALLSFKLGDFQVRRQKRKKLFLSRGWFGI
jgi:tetratricopeptide repeat protein 8